MTSTTDALENLIYATAFSGVTRFRARSAIERLRELIATRDSEPLSRIPSSAARSLITHVRRLRSECVTSEWKVFEDLLEESGTSFHQPENARGETYLATPRGIVLIEPAKPA